MICLVAKKLKNKNKTGIAPNVLAGCKNGGGVSKYHFRPICVNIKIVLMIVCTCAADNFKNTFVQCRRFFVSVKRFSILLYLPPLHYFWCGTSSLELLLFFFFSFFFLPWNFTLHNKNESF